MASMTALVLDFHRDAKRRPFASVADAATRQTFIAYEKLDKAGLFDNVAKGDVINIAFTIHPMPPTKKHPEGNVKLVVHDII